MSTILYFIIRILNDLMAEATMSTLKIVFKDLGIPYTLQSDAGTKCKSNVFHDFCMLCGTTYKISIPYSYPMVWLSASVEPSGSL